MFFSASVLVLKFPIPAAGGFKVPWLFQVLISSPKMNQQGLTHNKL